MKKVSMALLVIVTLALGVYVYVNSKNWAAVEAPSETSITVVATSSGGAVAVESGVAGSALAVTDASYCVDLKVLAPGTENSTLLTNVATGSLLVSGQVITGCVYPVNQTYDSWAPFEGQVGSVAVMAGDGTVLTLVPLKVLEENWMEVAMNNEPIAFQTVVLFDKGPYETGEIIFRNENASGEPERARQVVVPIVFQ